MKRIFFLFTLCLCNAVMAQEGTVGIGTQNPNRKAVLHLVARNSNQGLLVPTLSTQERVDFGTQLTAEENGMIVYDSAMNKLFYWMVDRWQAVSLSAGTGIEITNGVIVNTGDTDATDDFSGEWADLLNVPAGFADGIDAVDDADNDPTNEIELPQTAIVNQVLTYNGTSWIANSLPPDGDSDATNELQNLQFNNNILSITRLTNPTEINLAPFLGTNTDEQNLEFSGGIISLTGDPDNTQIDLSNYDTNVLDDFSGEWGDLLNVPAGFADGTDNVDDADASITNEIQDLSLSGNSLTITNNSSPTTIDLSPYLDNTDLLSTIAGSEGLVIKYSSGRWVAAQDNVNDGDNIPTNEIQDLQFSGQIITLSNDPGGTAINLAPYMDNTDAQNLQFSGGVISLSGDPDNTQINLSNYDTNVSDDFSGQWGDLLNVPAGFADGTDNVDDADASPTNEIQDLQFASQIITLTNDPGNTSINLAPYLDNTDAQNLQFASGIISLSGDPDNTQINLSNYDTDASDDFSGEWGDLLNVPAGFADGTDNVDDADASITNEIQDLNLTGDNLTITNNASPTTINLAPYMDNTDLLATLSGTAGQVLTWDGAAWGADDLPVDGDTDSANELQDLSLSGNILTITGLASPTPIDLSPYSGTNTDEQDLQFISGVISLTGDPDNTQIDLSNYDTNVLDDFSGDWGDLLNVPAGFADGVDAVDDADNDPTNEIQNMRFMNEEITLTNDPGNTVIDLAPYMDNTDLLATLSGTTAGQVLTWDGTVWGAADLPADGDTDNTNEFQDLQFVGEVITLSNDPVATSIDLAPYMDNTDAQDLQFVGEVITLTNDPDATSIDLAPYMDSPFTQSSDGFGNFAEYTGRIKATNVINTSAILTTANLTGSVLPAGSFNSAKIVMFDATGGATITSIDAGLNGQELLIVCTGGSLTFDNQQMNGSNLVLPTGGVILPAGGSIKLLYVASTSRWIHLESVTDAVNPN